MGLFNENFGDLVDGNLSVVFVFQEEEEEGVVDGRGGW